MQTTQHNCDGGPDCVVNSEPALGAGHGSGGITNRNEALPCAFSRGTLNAVRVSASFVIQGAGALYMLHLTQRAHSTRQLPAISDLHPRIGENHPNIVPNYQKTQGPPGK